MHFLQRKCQARINPPVKCHRHNVKLWNESSWQQNHISIVAQGGYISGSHLHSISNWKVFLTIESKESKNDNKILFLEIVRNPNTSGFIILKHQATSSFSKLNISGRPQQKRIVKPQRHWNSVWKSPAISIMTFIACLETKTFRRWFP